MGVQKRYILLLMYIADGVRMVMGAWDSMKVLFVCFLLSLQFHVQKTNGFQRQIVNLQLSSKVLMTFTRKSSRVVLCSLSIGAFQNPPTFGEHL